MTEAPTDLREAKLQWSCTACGGFAFNIIVFKGALYTVCAEASCKKELMHFVVPDEYYENVKARMKM
jgi:hypothetical protein